VKKRIYIYIYIHVLLVQCEAKTFDLLYGDDDDDDDDLFVFVQSCHRLKKTLSRNSLSFLILTRILYIVLI